MSPPQDASKANQPGSKLGDCSWFGNCRSAYLNGWSKLVEWICPDVEPIVAGLSNLIFMLLSFTDPPVGKGDENLSAAQRAELKEET